MDHAMKIRKVETDKKRYLDLLLLADEQENMIDRYLEHGTMYVLVEIYNASATPKIKDDPLGKFL